MKTGPCSRTLIGRHVFVAMSDSTYRACPCGAEPTPVEWDELRELRRLKLIEERAVAAARAARGSA